MSRAAFVCHRRGLLDMRAALRQLLAQARRNRRPANAQAQCPALLAAPGLGSETMWPTARTHRKGAPVGNLSEIQAKAKEIALGDVDVVTEEDDSCYDNGIESVNGEIE